MTIIISIFQNWNREIQWLEQIAQDHIFRNWNEYNFQLNLNYQTYGFCFLPSNMYYAQKYKPHRELHIGYNEMYRTITKSEEM